MQLKRIRPARVAVAVTASLLLAAAAMVAGLATLSVFDDEAIVEHAASMGDLWHKKLGELNERHEYVKEVRGRGQMIGIEFGAPTTAALKRRFNIVVLPVPDDLETEVSYLLA